MIVLDIESTGVDPCEDRIIELAFVVCYPDGTRKRACRRFNPGFPIPAEATAVHHITDEDVKDCPPFSDFAQKIWTALQGKDIGGYNLFRMDLPMLDEEFRRCDLKLDLTGVNVIDGFGIFQKKEPRDLAAAVRKYCGREHDGAHGAGADAEAHAEVIFGELEMYPDLAAMPIEEVAAFSRHGEVRYADLAGKLYYDAEGFIVYNFGKSKGVRVCDDPGFGRWMLGKNFPGSTQDVLRAEFQRMAEDQSDGGKVWE
jgi:DNA polymerase-3 subunit epsilon